MTGWHKGIEGGGGGKGGAFQISTLISNFSLFGYQLQLQWTHGIGIQVRSLSPSTLMSLTRLCSAHGHCLWQDSQPHPIMLPEFWRHHYHCTTKWLIAHGIKYRINLGIQPTCCWEWIGTMCLYHGNLALSVSDSWRPQYWRCVKNGSKFVSWIGGEPL